MERNSPHILVIGSSSRLLEGVADLLQAAGYDVDTSSSWTETEYALHVSPPGLVIVDLSSAASNAYRVSQQIRRTPYWAPIPILFVSFSGDDCIRRLQRHSPGEASGPIHFYAHSLLGVEGLLDTVRACMAE